MAFPYAQHVSTKKTPQSEPVQGKPMVPNSAGGFGFAVDDWVRLNRFLILGAEGGTYYVSERKLTQENAQCVLRCANLDAKRTIQTIVEISDSGRAPKNDPAIFALALLAGLGTPEVRKMSLDAMPKVCRIGTHLFHFVSAVQEFRGWGRQLKRSVADWYLSKKPKDLAYQCAKYQSRDGMSHRDVLRLTKPKVEADSLHNTIFKWSVGKEDLFSPEVFSPDHELSILMAFEKAKRTTDKGEIAKLIRDYNLPRECVPTQFLSEAVVWDALLDKMPMTAMIRNLGTMTKIGLLAPLSEASKKIVSELGNAERLKKSRIHPLSVLVALKIYQQGHGDKGASAWEPVQNVVDALDSAFYASFGNVEPTNKNWFFGIDVSGSMSAKISGMPLSCCEAATALAMVTNSVEPNTVLAAFNQGLQTLPIGKKSRLDDALRYTREVNFGGTDCSMPMLAAQQNKMKVDVFCVLTDIETWAGNIHPFQALQQYRGAMGIPSKLIVVGMTSNGFTIADPSDAGMMDVVGFDTAVPNVMSDFSK